MQPAGLHRVWSFTRHDAVPVHKKIFKNSLMDFLSRNFECEFDERMKNFR